MIKILTLVSFAAAALVAGTAIADNEAGPGPGQVPGQSANPTRFREHMEKHRARLHDKLQLAPEQETAWKPFSEKTQPQPPRAQALKSELAAMPSPARMDRMIALIKEREARMIERAAAVKEFYVLLKPEQQQVFDRMTVWPHRKQ